MEWLGLGAGMRVSPFTLDDKMVLIVRSGQIRMTFNDAADVSVVLSERDTYSVPAGVVRSIAAEGDAAAEALMVVSGDHRKRPVFAEEVISAARSAGQALDAGGYVAKAALLPDYKRAG